MDDSINVTKSSMPDYEEYIEEIKDLWDSHWLTNMGVKHERFKAKLIEYLTVPNLTLFTNGHLALESTIAAFGLRGEVITTPFTFASTTHAIVRNGLTPVFCDIEPTDFTIDVKKIESLISEKTSAIIPVHVYGNVCDVNNIQKIAAKYNLKVIYDAAHAFGVRVNDNGIGSFGDATVFSFHATKVFNTIEGGAVAYHNKELERTLCFIKNYGITDPETVEYVGGNAKMNEFQAAMGLCNLRCVDHEIQKRQILVERYRTNLAGVKGIKIFEPQYDVKSNYAYFPVIFDEKYKSRDVVYKCLCEQKIFARKYFYPLTTDFDCYKERFNSKATPIAKHMAGQVLTLPLYADLNLKDIDRICDIVKNR